MEANDYLIFSLDPKTLHEKDIGIQNLPTITPTFVESLVLIDRENDLS